MPDALGEGEVCVRCGHTRRRPVATTTKMIRAIRGKPPRAKCGEQTEHGWECPCRSRFHAR